LRDADLHRDIGKRLDDHRTFCTVDSEPCCEKFKPARIFA
jgi:hypothetical protein